MPEKERTPGAQANVDFVAKTKAKPPESAELIPADCLGCSTAWLHALRGRSDRLQNCEGRSEETITTIAAETLGPLSLMLCHLPQPVKELIFVIR